MPGRIAETAKMVAELDLKTGKFTKGVSTAVGSLGKLTGAAARSRAVAVGVGVGLERLAETGIRALSGAIETGIQGALTLEKAQAQTQAAIESTGGVAGVTAQQVRDLAQSMEDLTTADDKTIQQGENLLLTFRGIGKDTFPAATAAMVNMAIALNKGDAATADFDGSAIRLGKALQDPIKGVVALEKAGVNLSVAQVDQIKKLAGQGNALKDLTEAHVALDKKQKAYIKDLGSSVGPLTAARKAGVKLTKAQEASLKAIEDGSGYSKAQKIILAELEKEFGKAGEAAGTGFQADINRANDALEDAQIAIAQGLMPALGEVAREMSKTFRDPQVIQGLKDLGTGIGDVIKGGVAFAKTVPWGTIASSLRTAAGFAKDLLNAFLGLPTWVQTAVITGWGLNKLSGGLLTDVVGELGKGLIKGVLGMTAGVVNINAATVNGGGLPGGIGGAAAGLGIGTIVLGAGAAAILGGLIAEAIVTPISNAIDPAGQAAAAAGQSLGQRDPRRFNAAGQVIQNYLPKIAANTGIIGPDIEKLRGVIAPKAGPGIGDKGAQPRMEAQRGTKADALAAAQFKVIAKSKDIEALRGTIGDKLRDETTAVRRSADVIATLRAKVQDGARDGVAATRASAATISSSIAANRPITNVDVRVSATTVQKTVTVQTRYGPIGGDRNTGDSIGTGQGHGGP